MALNLDSSAQQTPMSDTVYKQLDYMASVIDRLEESMIDPREFGRLEGAVAALKTELDDVKDRQAAMDDKIDLVLAKLGEARGGWKLLMALGGAAATLGSIITWFATHSVTVGPKP
jgi:hypothetical protein